MEILAKFIFLPGNYLMNSSIALPDSVILKGFSSTETTLSFDLGSSPANRIAKAGTAVSPFVQIDEGYIKDNDWIILPDFVSLFNAFDYVEIIQENGTWDVEPAEWATRSVGQIIQIDHIDGDTIFLMSPLRITYDASLNPRIRKITPRRNAGVECLKIKRLENASAGANIVIALAANCAIRGVESDTGVSAHVDIFQSTRILVEGCYFHHSFVYDGASKHGYGVTLNTHSGGCLIVNNIFRYLRHAMMVKTGANGNVFGYNYSREIYRSEQKHDYGGDISLYGHYAFANLFERKMVHNLNIDLEWVPIRPKPGGTRGELSLSVLSGKNGPVHREPTGVTRITGLHMVCRSQEPV